MIDKEIFALSDVKEFVFLIKRKILLKKIVFSFQILLKKWQNYARFTVSKES